MQFYTCKKLIGFFFVYLVIFENALISQHFFLLLSPLKSAKMPLPALFQHYGFVFPQQLLLDEYRYCYMCIWSIRNLIDSPSSRSHWLLVALQLGVQSWEIFFSHGGMPADVITMQNSFRWFYCWDSMWLPCHISRRYAVAAPVSVAIIIHVPSLPHVTPVLGRWVML